MPSHGSWLCKELGIAPIFKEELQVFGVKAELTKRAAQFVGDRGVRRSSSPPVAPARVLELQIAAVCKIQDTPVECGVNCVSCRVSLGVLSEVHKNRVTKAIA